MHPVQAMQEDAGEPASQDLLRIHAARFTPAAYAGADDEILPARRYRFDQLRQEFRTIAAIAVEKGDDCAASAKCLDTGLACPAITAARFAHDPGARRTCPRGCLIGAAIVDDNDLANILLKNSTNDIADCGLFIEGRNDDADSAITAFRGTLARGRRQRLHLRPQLAQALGGSSDSNARRKSWYRSPFQISRKLCCEALPRVKLS